MRSNPHELPVVNYAALDTQHVASAKSGGTGAQNRMIAPVIQSAVRFWDEHILKISSVLIDIAMLVHPHAGYIFVFVVAVEEVAGTSIREAEWDRAVCAIAILRFARTNGWTRARKRDYGLGMLYRCRTRCV
jgi:hypothetical protein